MFISFPVTIVGGAARETLSEALKDRERSVMEIDFVEVVGYTANAKSRIFIDGKLMYTNYFGLYKLDGKWLMVNKLFNAHH